MKATMFERNCADCPLRVLASGRCREAERQREDLDPESAAERQLERSFGANWKW
jgi:hypothetical protein